MSAITSDSPSRGQLSKRIASLSIRNLQLGVVDGCLWTVAAMVIGVLLLSWLDMIWDLSVTVRVVALSLVAVFGIGVLCARIVRAWRASAASKIARRMDIAGKTGGQILSGWELFRQRRPPASDTRQALSQGIADVAVDQAAVKALEISPREVAPWSMVKRSAIVSLGAAILVAVFAAVAPRAFATSWDRLFAPSQDTPPYSPLVFQVQPGDVTLTYGQPLEVKAEIVGGAVESAELVLGAVDDPKAKRVAMFPRDRGHWQAVVSRVTEPTEYWVAANRGRSSVYRVDVLDLPRIKSIGFTITAPDYTRLPAKQGRHPQDRVAGLKGSLVELAVESDRPLRNGEIQVVSGTDDQTAEDTVILSVDADPHRATATMLIEQPATWTISVTGKNGVRSESSLPIEVELLIDRPPAVRIARPQPRSYATPTTRIPIAAVAEDDFGLSRFRLYRILDGSRPLPQDLPLETGLRIAQGSAMLPLDQFGLEPGDKITLFARVEDTRPEQLQASESSLTEIEIISQADFNRMVTARQGQQMLEQKFRQTSRLLEQLASQAAELQEQIDNADPNDPAAQRELQKRAEQLRDRMRDVAQELEDLAEQTLPIEIDEAWNEVLKQHAQTLRDAAQAAELLAQQGGKPKDQADQMQQAINKARQAQQQQIDQPLEALRKILPLIAAESEFVRLVARQRVLVDELDRFREQESVTDAADRQQVVLLREEEAKIRETLTDLLAEIERRAEQLGDDPDFQPLRQSSLEFVQAIRDSDIDAELAAARTALGEFNTQAGYAHALAALEQLEQFLKQCENCQGEGKACLKQQFAPTLPGSGAGAAIDRMLSQLGSHSGSGSGYSMRGNTGQNVGLYGNQPFAQPTGRGQGDNGRLMPAAADQADPGNQQRDAFTAANRLPESVNSSVRDVPLRYRSQAESYLQRVAEGVEQ